MKYGGGRVFRQAQDATCQCQKQGSTQCWKVPPAEKAAASTPGRKTWAALANVVCRSLFLPLLKLYMQKSQIRAPSMTQHIY